MGIITKSLAASLAFAANVISTEANSLPAINSGKVGVTDPATPRPDVFIPREQSTDDTLLNFIRKNDLSDDMFVAMEAWLKENPDLSEYFHEMHKEAQDDPCKVIRDANIMYDGVKNGTLTPVHHDKRRMSIILEETPNGAYGEKRYHEFKIIHSLGLYEGRVKESLLDDYENANNPLVKKMLDPFFLQGGVNFAIDEYLMKEYMNAKEVSGSPEDRDKRIKMMPIVPRPEPCMG
jgi:hypothetical protein